jgi:hypothetical protein
MNKLWIALCVGVVLVGVVAIIKARENTNSSSPAPVTTTLPPTPPAEPEMSGLHIMTDGMIMAPDGSVVTDAVILPDGNLQMKDGRILKPMTDYRAR